MKDEYVYTMWTEILDESGDITHAPLHETRCYDAGFEILRNQADNEKTAPVYIERYFMTMPSVPGVIVHKNKACKKWENRKKITCLK